MKEVVGSVRSGLVGLHMKRTLEGELFPIFRNWIILADESFQGLQDPKMSKHQMQKR